MRTWRRRLCIVLALALVGCSAQPAASVKAGEVSAQNAGLLGAASAKTPFEKYGKLSVKGAQLVEKNGKAVQLKGVSSHGMSWYPQYMNEKAMRTMRDNWGVEVVRLAMYTAEYNGYCTGDKENRNKLRKEIYEAVDAAEKLGMYVIIDWHILSDSDPVIYQSQAKTFFKTMAKR